MKIKPPHPTAGLRVVFCTRPDCKFTGDPVAGPVREHCLTAGITGPVFWCLADVLLMDRRVNFGLACARFVARRADSLGGSEGATGPRDANGG